MRTRNLAVAIAAVALAAGACDTLTGLFSDTTVRLGILEWTSSVDTASAMNAALFATDDPSEPGVPRLEAPDTVSVGEAFTVRITTWAAHGCWMRDRTEVEQEPLAAHVAPYDRDDNDGTQGCPTELTDIEHSAELRFTEPGEARVEVTGYRVVDGDTEAATAMTMQKTIHVR